MALPEQVTRHLRTASAYAPPARQYTCQVFGNEWDRFVEEWAPKIHNFLLHALGPFGMEPLPTILPLEDGAHTAGATASFYPANGQVRLSKSTEGKPGQILEKMTHEFTHGNWNDFQPSEDIFYCEGFVDYGVWIMSHAPVWEPYRDLMIEAAAYNIAVRRERAMLDQTDMDRKRWAGGLYASISRGPFLIASLHHRKMEGNLVW